MAQVQKSAAALHIAGDELIPEEITRLLGVAPTEAHFKGEKIVGRKTGRVRIAKTGMWKFKAPDHEPEDLNGQIHEIFSRMSNDLTVWRNITEKYHVDLFCGLFLKGGNEGLEISPQCLEALGSRGIMMGLDIYSGNDDEDDEDSKVVS